MTRGWSDRAVATVAPPGELQNHLGKHVGPAGWIRRERSEGGASERLPTWMRQTIYFNATSHKGPSHLRAGCRRRCRPVIPLQALTRTARDA